MKKVLSFLLALVMLFSVITISAVESAAIGNYGVNLDSACYSSSNPFRNYWGQCTWYAWGRALEKTGVALSHRGDAKTWTSGAVSTPRANSVVVWTGGTYGHVAFVEAYDGTNIYITEANRVPGQYSEGVINLSTRRFTYTYGGSGGYTIDLPYGYIYCGSSDKTPPSVDNYRAFEFRDGLFTIDSHVTDASGIRSVRYAVWTTNNGQDDLVWYNGNNTGAFGNDHFWTWVAFSEHKNERGTYIMDIYATDNAGNETSKRISYTFPDKAPTVSNIQVTDVSSKGYTVKCTVKSVSEMGVSRVQFPTWTANNGQDDLASEWWTNTKVRGTISGNTVTFRVNASEHNNEKGTYITHIYAYDIIGNTDSVGVSVNVHDHKYIANVVAPKSATIGYTQYKCSNCKEDKKDVSGNIIRDNFTAPTGKPSGLKCTARTAAAMKFTWNKTAGVTGYQVQILNAKGGNAGLKALTGNTYTFTKLAAGHAYKARVRFYIKAADGKNYYGAWVTINSPTLPAGTSLTKVTPAKKAFTAQWKANKTVTGYQIQYATNNKFTSAGLKAIKGASKLKLTVSSLKGGTKYFVRIRTYKTIGGKNYFSAWSGTKSVVTKK